MRAPLEKPATTPSAAFRSRGTGRRWQWVALVPLTAAGLAWLWAVDPAQAGAYPPCALHWLTGLHCPGCGSTRAAHALLHANFLAALCFNPLLVIGAPAAAVAAAWQRYKTGRFGLPAISGRAILAVLLLFAVARNIPCFPFNVLAPHRPTVALETTSKRLDRSAWSNGPADSVRAAQAPNQGLENQLANDTARSTYAGLVRGAGEDGCR